MKQLIYICMLFFLCVDIGIAQEVLQKHTVTQGETIIQIAKMYNVTPYDIQQANKETLSSLDDLKVDVILIIPKSKINTPQLESKADALKTSAVAITNSTITYTVQKGDTKFGLAKRFNTTIPQLEAQNPHIVAGMNEGHILKINTSVEPTSLPTSIVENKPSTINGYRNYLVKYGDTKFSLAKNNNLTIEELERLNPHIVSMLQVGHTIRIPSTTTTISENSPNNITADPQPKVPEEQTPNSSDTETPMVKAKESYGTNTLESQVDAMNSVADSNKTTQKPSTDKHTDTYELYVVQPNETLFGLSKRAGMTIEDFLKLNPQLKESVQIGARIKMPKNTTETSDQAINPTTSAPIVATRYKDLTLSMNKGNKKNLLFILPFSESQLNQDMSGLIKGSSSNAFKKEHLEFYSGAKIAIDSLKKLGLNVNLAIQQFENDRNGDLGDLTSNPNPYDAVLIPFYSGVEEEVAAAVNTRQTPVVTASTVVHKKNLDNLFEAVPSLNQQRQKVLDYILSKQANIIVINDVNRSESRQFIESQVPDAKFVELKKNGSFQESELMAQLDKIKVNYIILDSERNSVFLNVTNILLSELSNYKLQLAVLESGLIPNNDNVSVKRFRILKMVFPSLVSAESTIKLQKFSDVYEKTYNLQPSQNAIFGFDITFDTSLRLSQEKSFVSSARNDITEYVNLKFSYKANNHGGYDNTGIYVLQYDINDHLQEAN